jgi:Protein of unknown function with HXXEE motif
VGQAQRLRALCADRLRPQQRARVRLHDRRHSRITRSERRALDLAYYTLVVTQQAVFNAVFHVGTTIAYREYSPGVVTSVLMVPLWRRLTGAALTEHRLSEREVIACALVAGVVHAAVVARQVYFVGVPEGKRSEPVALGGNER